jgi:hypothetical protein
MLKYLHQVAAPTLSHVGSVEIEMTYNECKRRMLIIQVLNIVSKCVQVETEVDLHSTKGKSKHDSNLLPPWKLERAESRHRSNEDGQVRKNVQRCIGEPESFLIQAAGWPCVGLVPEIVYRVAYENRSEHGDETIDAHDSHDSPIGYAREFMNEYAKVLHEDRDFDKCEADVVHYYADPQCLCQRR